MRKIRGASSERQRVKISDQEGMVDESIIASSQPILSASRQKYNYKELKKALLHLGSEGLHCKLGRRQIYTIIDDEHLERAIRNKKASVDTQNLGLY